jgi:helix-turn-helix protein
MIKLAASKGYIERINVKQTEEGRKGGSKSFVINRVSHKGKKLVQKLITEEEGK